MAISLKVVVTSKVTCFGRITGVVFSTLNVLTFELLLVDIAAPSMMLGLTNFCLFSLILISFTSS